MARDCPNYQTASFPSGRPRTALCGAGVSLRAAHFAGVGKMVGLSAGFRHAALIGRLPRYPDTQITQITSRDRGPGGGAKRRSAPPTSSKGSYELPVTSYPAARHQWRGSEKEITDRRRRRIHTGTGARTPQGATPRADGRMPGREAAARREQPAERRSDAATKGIAELRFQI